MVVTGAGRAFAAGADIAAMREMTPIQGEAFSRLGHRVTVYPADIREIELT